MNCFGGHGELRKAKDHFACIWDSVTRHQDARGVEGCGGRRMKSTKFLKKGTLGSDHLPTFLYSDHPSFLLCPLGGFSAAGGQGSTR